MFGDRPNQANFCDNGIILGNRNTTAKTKEVSRLSQGSAGGFRPALYAEGA